MAPSLALGMIWTRKKIKYHQICCNLIVWKKLRLEETFLISSTVHIFFIIYYLWVNTAFKYICSFFFKYHLKTMMWLKCPFRKDLIPKWKKILPISLFTLVEADGAPLPELLDPIEQVILVIFLSKVLCFSEKINKIWNMVFCYQNYSSDREKLLKFEAEGRKFAKVLRSLEQFIQPVEGQNNFW